MEKESLPVSSIFFSYAFSLCYLIKLIKILMNYIKIFSNGNSAWHFQYIEFIKRVKKSGQNDE